MKESSTVGLADALEALREELATARAKAAGEDLQFPIQSVTIELKLGVTISASGKAGFRVPVVGAELGGSAGYDRASIQTLTLVLGAPVDQYGEPVKVANLSDERKT